MSNVATLIKKINESIKETRVSNKNASVLIEKHLKSVEKSNRDVIAQLKEQKNSLDIIQKVSSIQMWDDLKGLIFDKMLSTPATLELIKRDKKSFACFRDQDLFMVVRERHVVGKQTNTERYRHALIDAISEKNDNYLIGLSQKDTADFRVLTYTEIGTDIHPYFEEIKQIGNEDIYHHLFFANYKDEAIKLWKSLWEGLNIKILCFDEKEYQASKTFFDNAKSLSFISINEEHAFETLDETLENIKNDNNTDLYLVALDTPSAVYVHSLSKAGKWAIDFNFVNNTYKDVTGER